MREDVLGVPFYRFYYDKNEEIVEAVKKLNYKPNNTNHIWEGVHDDGVGGSDLYNYDCLLYTSPSPRDATLSRMGSSA